MRKMTLKEFSEVIQDMIPSYGDCPVSISLQSGTGLETWTSEDVVIGLDARDDNLIDVSIRNFSVMDGFFDERS